MRKAISLLSAIIFIGFTISVTALVYQTGMPIIEKMQTSAAVERVKADFINIDEKIQRVASEVNGSRRTINFRTDPGYFIVDDANDLIYWIVETAAPVFSPRSASYYGNLIFGSNLETSAYEGDYLGIPCFVLENEHLIAYVRKIGSAGSPQTYSTPELLVAMYQKDLGKWMDATLNISVDGAYSGTGYTVLEHEGRVLPYATVTASMESGTNYTIDLILESGADFIEVEGSPA